MGSGGFTFPGLRLDISYGTGFVVETGFYCAYTCLFIAAFPGMTQAKRLKDSHNARSAWVFLIFSIMMYLVATIHLVFAGFRFYKGIFLNVDPNGPIAYFMNPSNWEYLGLIVVFCIQTWLGDVLVIYRCYCVWDNNLWLVLIPIGLLLSSIGTSSYLIYWIGHPSVAPPSICLTNAIYPLAFVQNFITTSLIILKIVLQHWQSKKAGVVDVGSRLSLIHIVRVVIESAGIYTIQILVVNILYFRTDSFQFVVLSAIMPSIGITFLLLAIRIEGSRNAKKMSESDLGIRSSMLPRWLCEHDREAEFEDREDSHHVPTGDCTDTTTQKSVVGGESATESLNLDSESTFNSVTQPKVAAISNLSPKNGAAYATEPPV